MNYKSHTSKGYTPKPSGPNMKGYYMGESSNLLSMMQEGGVPSAYKTSFSLTGTPGGARLARALQRRRDFDTLEKYQRQEAERQKKGRLFGSIGGLAGGFLGAAALGLTPFTGGASLGLATGLGTALGKGIGERVGAGKARDYDESGTVYMQDAFGDVDTASEDYSKGILGRALSSGAMAGLTAGLTPGGGIHGKTRDFASKLNAAQLAKAVPVADTALLNMPGLETPTIDTGSFSQTANVFDPMTGSRIGALPDMDFFSQGTLGLSKPSQDLMPTTPFQDLSAAIAARDTGDIGAQSFINQAYEGTGGDWEQAIQNYQSLFGAQEGGLIGMQYGGYGGGTTAQSVLEQAGFAPSDAQLGLFEELDTSPISAAKRKIGAQFKGPEGIYASSSFGAKQQSLMDMLQAGQEQQKEVVADTLKQYQSGIYDTAASIIAGGGEFDPFTPPEDQGGDDGQGGTTTENPLDSPGTRMYETAEWNGVTYVWNGTEWVPSGG